MCLAIPGQIKHVDGREATIEYPGETRTAFLGDDVKAKPGDYVMVQMGIIVKKISAKEAGISIKSWNRNKDS